MRTCVWRHEAGYLRLSTQCGHLSCIPEAGRLRRVPGAWVIEARHRNQVARTQYRVSGLRVSASDTEAEVPRFSYPARAPISGTLPQVPRFRYAAQIFSPRYPTSGTRLRYPASCTQPRVLSLRTQLNPTSGSLKYPAQIPGLGHTAQLSSLKHPGSGTQLMYPASFPSIRHPS